MLVCMRYTELMCIPDVWPRGHYGSGPRPCVCVCLCMSVCRCMHLCVYLVYIMGKVLSRVCVCVITCMLVCV